MDFKKKPKVKRVSSSKKTASKSTEEKRLSLDFRGKDLSKQIELAEKIVVGHTKEFFFGKISNLRNVRNLVLVWLFLMGGLLLSVALFRNFSQSTYKQSQFVDGGIYSEGLTGEIKTLNPIFATTEAEKSFSKLAFVSLFDIDSSGKLNTQLAKTVSTSDDYKSFEVKIAENAVWSDGEKLTADDVIFTTEILRDKNLNPSSYSSWSGVKVSKKSDFELKFEMPTASKLVLYAFNFPILPKHKFAGVEMAKIRENQFSRNPVTSGKFNFESITRTDDKTTILLARNEKYFAGAPKLTKFELVTYSSEENLKSALVGGEISGSPSVNLRDFDNSKKSALDERQMLVNRGVYAFFNTSTGVFKDKSIRQAVQKGVDVSKILSKMYAVENLSFPVLREDLNIEKLERPTINIEEARKKLDEAGWILNGKTRVKDGQKLRINLVSTNEKNLENATRELKNQLENLGLEVEITIADKDDKSGSFIQSVLDPRSYDILVYEIDFGADSADVYAFWHSSQANSNGLNFSNFSDAVSDDILLNARTASSDQKQKELLTAFSKRWLDQAPAIAISRSKTNYVFRKSVKTFDSQNKFVEKINRYADVQYWQVDKSELYKTP